MNAPINTKNLLFLFLGAIFVFTLFETPQALAGSQPYAGQQWRSIKALSAKEIQDYRKGAGLGMAKAAELNHYPGPIHVLEFAEQLGLSIKQKKKIETLYKHMKADAVPLGNKIIALEYELNQLFATEKIQKQSLKKLVGNIAQHKGRLRNVHLRVHLKTKPLLTLKQLVHYDRLRGYGNGSTSHKKNKHKGH